MKLAGYHGTSTIEIPTLKDIQLTESEKRLALAIIGELWYEWEWYRYMTDLYRRHEGLSRHEARVAARSWVASRLIEDRLITDKGRPTELPPKFRIKYD